MTRGGLSRRFLNSPKGPMSTGSTPVVLPLDAVTGAVGAYSMRRLKAAYAGQAIRVRRASDNTEQDIGFVGNDLNAGALLTFVGAGDGFISKIYNQAGGLPFDLAQTTAILQPRIVLAGALVTSNGKVCPDFMGIATLIAINYTATFAGITAATMVAGYRDRPASRNFAVALSSGDNWTRFGGAGYTGLYLSARFDNQPATVASGLNSCDSYRCSNTANYSMRRNGTELLNLAMGVKTFSIRDDLNVSPSVIFVGTDKCIDGWIYEIIIYPSYLSLGDTQTLEANVQAYWGIP